MGQYSAPHHPNEQELLQALRNVSRTLAGGKALHQALKEAHPAWVLNQRRVKKLCKVCDIKFTSPVISVLTPHTSSDGSEGEEHRSGGRVAGSDGGEESGSADTSRDAEAGWEMVRREMGIRREGDDDEDAGFVVLTKFS